MATFSTTTDAIVGQLDPKGSIGLIPAYSPYNADKLVLMSLVVKKNKRFPWQRTKYEPTLYNLSDILDEPLSSAFLPAKEFVSYEGTSGNTGGGMLGVEAGMAGVTLETKRTAKKQTSVGTLKREEVDVKKLQSDTRDRKVDMEHVLVRQQTNKVREPVLTVLTERIVTTSDCTLSEHFSCEGQLGLTATTIPAKVKASANVQCDRDASMGIPAGTVFAYKVVDLGINCMSGDVQLCLYGRGYFNTGGVKCLRASEEEAWNSKDHLEIKELRLLAELPWALPGANQGFPRSALFQGLCEVLKDREALRDVENTLDEWCSWCSGDAPVQTEQDGSVSHSNSASAVLDLLRPYLNTPEYNRERLTGVHTLVSAMEALPDEALDLLSESSPDFLEAVNALVEHALKPQEGLPLPLQDDKAFQWAQQLLITSNVTVKTENGRLSVQTEGEDQLPLVLHVTVHGLSSLCGARMEGIETDIG